jgi:uncharacterized protein (TIRG00374 family)
MASRSDLLRLLIRVIGPTLLVAVVWSLDDKAALWRTVKEADWLLLGAAVAANVPIVHFKVVRWQKLLRACGYRYSLGRTYLAVLSSLYLGMVTPGRLGDALRIQYVKHDIGAPYTAGLAATLMDRFCDLYVLAALVALGTVHFASELSADLANITWAAVAIAVLAPSAFLLRGPSELLSRVLRRLTNRWHASVDALLSALRGLIGKSLVVAIALTVASFAVNYFQGWLVAGALGIELSYVDVASLLATASLLGLIPISVSGIGVRELFLALVFPALGLLAAQGVAFGLVVFLCNHLAIVFAGFVAWQIAPPPFSDASHFANS